MIYWWFSDDVVMAFWYDTGCILIMYWCTVVLDDIRIFHWCYTDELITRCQQYKVQYINDIYSFPCWNSWSISSHFIMIGPVGPRPRGVQYGPQGGPYAEVYNRGPRGGPERWCILDPDQRVQTRFIALSFNCF